MTSDDEFSDDSLENAHPQRDTCTQIIEIKLESRAKSEEEKSPEELSSPLKCCPGIAWEIKMNENATMDQNMKV